MTNFLEDFRHFQIFHVQFSRDDASIKISQSFRSCIFHYIDAKVVNFNLGWWCYTSNSNGLSAAGKIYRQKSFLFWTSQYYHYCYCYSCLRTGWPTHILFFFERILFFLFLCIKGCIKICATHTLMHKIKKCLVGHHVRQQLYWYYCYYSDLLQLLWKLIH